MPSLRQAFCQALRIQESVRRHLSLKELESCFLYDKSERKAGVQEINFLSSSSPESQGHAVPTVNTKICLLPVALIRSADYRLCLTVEWRAKGRAGLSSSLKSLSRRICGDYVPVGAKINDRNLFHKHDLPNLQLEAGPKK